jgi:RNA polymerase sigma-70 factor (sigma-E family)
LLAEQRLAGTLRNRGDSVLPGYGWGVSVGGDHVVAGARGNGATPRSRHAGTEGQSESARGTAAGAQVERAAAAHAPWPRAQQEEPPAPGDPAFHEYVTSRSGSLLRMAYLLTRNRADAEDLVQAALAKTYQAWDRIEDRGAVDGYVRRAMVNTHISWWRRRRVEEYPTDEIPDQPVIDHAGDSEVQDALRRAIERLPQRMRAAVVLRYYEDMSEAEIANVLGVSLGTVKSTVSRAVAKLRIDADLLES